ncbi:LysR family transcriptional regulator [Amycolatopsis orientalis]|uniref:LysR family transcriptional regulator n=1 Tax=Amycolatopsis orientalis TaxID=31958 RepID=A0A193BRA3_AMYOR|nr:LysR family transcriptional regulator [Amycolatopsis orientalis]ANN14736.1 LysR family transcriptional regulator [Amycolatopsis orientalis]
MEIQVRHLRVLCEIASSGSLNRAAAGLGLGQPALSHQLRRIERMVGGALFHRDQHGVRPTELGALILRRARAIVLTFDELDHDFHRQEPAPGEPLRIGWNDSAITGSLLGVLRELRPGEPVRTRADTSRTRLLAQVANRGIDLALIMICGGRGLPVPPEVRTTTLATEPSFVAVPAGHPLAGEEEIELAGLAGEDWIVSSGGDGCRVVFREMCLAHGFDPRITHDVDFDIAREDLVGGGYGVGLVQPTRQAADGLVIRPLAGAPMCVRHVLAWREDGPCAATVQDLATEATAGYWRLAERTAPYRTWLHRHGRLAAG